MEVIFERAAAQELIDSTAVIGQACRRARDEEIHALERCRQRYTRLQTELEQVIHRASRDVEQAEADYRSAHQEYQSAMQEVQSAENGADHISARLRARAAQEDMRRAQQARQKAQEKLQRANASREKLNRVWSEHAPAARAAQQRLEEELYAYHDLAARSVQALEQYSGLMERARATLYDSAGDGASVRTPGGGPAAVPAAAPAAGTRGLGWCRRHRMQAVFIRADGVKQFSIDIGGQSRNFPCTKSGAARAYREAVRRGDETAMARTSAIFEVETLREDLELGAGDPDVLQLGGYHGDVRLEDPAQNESHHIPAQSVQDEKADWLPTLSISKEDHKLTSSYAGKQGRRYQSFLPDETDAPTYKQEVAQLVGEGGAGYVQAVRSELYDLRTTTGHKYDGGVSAYLDAVVDMIASRGVPGSRSNKNAGL